MFSLTSCSLKKVTFKNVKEINPFNYAAPKNDFPVFEKGQGVYSFIIENRDDKLIVLLPDLYFQYGVFWEKIPKHKIQKLQNKINDNERLWVKINCKPTTFNFPYNLENEADIMFYISEDIHYRIENPTIKLANIESYEFFIGPKLKIVPESFVFEIDIDR